ncbi:hypothetical protein D3C84_901060 [compost metagenome]
MAFWPWLLKISPRLLSSLVTMAVEDNDKPAPSNNAGVVDTPSNISNPPSSMAVPNTCRLPRPNTT